MTFNPANVGAAPNDGTGDSLRNAFIKVNANFELLAAAIFPNIEGSPEGVLTASSGVVWDKTNRVLYVKDYGTGNTGWREIIA